MVAGLGGIVAPVSAPFDPEAGAYSQGQGQTPGHHHGRTSTIITTTATIMAEAKAARLPDEAMPGAPEPAADSTRRRRAPLAALGLQRLLAWLSPSFPVGAYSYSHGLEWAIEDGTVKSAADLEAWLGDILRHGAGRSDAILFAHAFRAAAAERYRRARRRRRTGRRLPAVPGAPSRSRPPKAAPSLMTVSQAWPNDRA